MGNNFFRGENRLAPGELACLVTIHCRRRVGNRLATVVDGNPNHIGGRRETRQIEYSYFR